MIIFYLINPSTSKLFNYVWKGMRNVEGGVRKRKIYGILVTS